MNKRQRISCSFPGCEKSFSTKYNLQDHTNIHTGQHPYLCKFPNCNGKFKNRGGLFNHSQQHLSSPRFKCLYCNKLFTRNDNCLRHEMVHRKKDEIDRRIKSKQSSMVPIHPLEKITKFVAMSSFLNITNVLSLARTSRFFRFIFLSNAKYHSFEVMIMWKRMKVKKGGVIIKKFLANEVADRIGQTLFKCSNCTVKTNQPNIYHDNNILCTLSKIFPIAKICPSKRKMFGNCTYIDFSKLDDSYKLIEDWKILVEHWKV